MSAIFFNIKRNYQLERVPLQELTDAEITDVFRDNPKEAVNWGITMAIMLRTALIEKDEQHARSNNSGECAGSFPATSDGETAGTGG